GCGPIIQKLIVLQQTMPSWEIFGLEDELQRNPFARVVDHSETDRIASALLRQTWAGFRVSQVARPKLFVVRLSLLMTRSRAETSPASAERQTSRMRKSNVIGAIGRIKKWTSQNETPAAARFQMIVITDGDTGQRGSN